jgi:acyl dehydratase
MTDTRLSAGETSQQRFDIPVWNAENRLFDDYVVGERLRSIRRTITEGEAANFNTFVMDLHPYASDEPFAQTGPFGTRIVAGAMTFCIGLGLVQTNNPDMFSYGYDRLRFIKPVYIGDTIYTVRTVLERSPKTEAQGMIRFAYEIYKTGDPEDLVVYCEHLQLINRARND